MTLEERIAEQRLEIKRWTYVYVRRGTPYRYMENLAKIGERDYDVPYISSIMKGVDAARDYYMENPNFMRKYHSLVKGAEAILSYVYNSIPDSLDEDF